MSTFSLALSGILPLDSSSCLSSQNGCRLGGLSRAVLVVTQTPFCPGVLLLVLFFFFLTYSFFIYLTECVLVAACVHAQSLQSCLTLCDPMDCTPPGFSVHGILQARIREWVAILFSRGSSQPRDWTWVSHIAGRFFTI